MTMALSSVEQRVLRSRRHHVLAITLAPLLGFAAAVWLLWGRAVGVEEVLLLAGMWTASGLAGTVGFHRLFAHRSFRARPAVRIGLAILGSMAGQGPVIYWAALHREHHQYSDRPGDPHSPHLHDQTLRGRLAGAWHSHIGWMFSHRLPNSARYTPDLLEDKALVRVNNLYFVWLLLGLAIPTVVGGLWRGSLLGAFYGFLWGGLARLFIGEHLIWSVNSLCHLYGTRPHRVLDHSANNVWLSVFTFGESLHNNHHAFPSSAIFGLSWWQPDPGAWLIRGLEKLGLVWHVKKPSPQTLEARRLRRRAGAPAG